MGVGNWINNLELIITQLSPAIFMYVPANLDVVPSSNMLTHCPKISIYECRFCGKRGEDCLRSCPHCLQLNPLEGPINNWRIHLHDKKKELIYIARILCKKCSLWHIRHSLGARIFDVRIFTSSSFPDQQQKWVSLAGGTTGSYMPPDLVITEDIKPTYLGLFPNGSRFVCGWTCTACHFHYSSGMCKHCRAVNESRMKDRIRLINGHLHIVDAYCDWHQFRVYSFYHHQHIIRPALPDDLVTPTPVRRHHPYSNEQIQRYQAAIRKGINIRKDLGI